MAATRAPRRPRSRRRARNANGETAEHLFQLYVLSIAAFYGWLAYHTHNSHRSQPGFPDLVLVRGTELLFVELKTDTGTVRPDQGTWLDALAIVCDAIAAGDTTAAVEQHVWRPCDWDDLQHRLARGRTFVPASFDPRV